MEFCTKYLLRLSDGPCSDPGWGCRGRVRGSALPSGGNIWDAGKRKVQEVLLVAKHRTGQRVAEAKSRVAMGTLLGVRMCPMATAALEHVEDP